MENKNTEKDIIEEQKSEEVIVEKSEKSTLEESESEDLENEHKEQDLLEELRKKRLIKRQERERQVKVYKTMIAGGAAALVCVAVLVAAAFGKPGNKSEDTKTNIETSAVGEEAEESIDQESTLAETTPTEASEETIEEETTAAETTVTETTVEETTVQGTTSAETAPAETTPAETTAPDPLAAYGNPAVANVADSLNMRAGKDYTSAIVKAIPGNGICDVLSDEGEGWSKVRYDGQEGYVNNMYLLTGTRGRKKALEILGIQ